MLVQSIIFICCATLVLIEHNVYLFSFAAPINTLDCCPIDEREPFTKLDLAVEIEELRSCLDQLNHNINSSHTVTFVSFASPGIGEFSIPDIDDFAIYQRAIMTAYTAEHNYKFMPITSYNISEFHETTDSRWFKIKILLDALDPEYGWAKESSYIVWIDSDAIVLDMGLQIEELGRLHEQADFIASADIRMGLVNTGMMVLRNTPWMRQFLRDWWHGPNPTASSASQWRKQQCDQDAFDRLYASYAATRHSHPNSPDHIATKVNILPMDALNSHPPAMLHQREDNAVLHLMGEETAVRRAVFRRGWVRGMCSAKKDAENPSYLPQLGLHRNVLKNIAIGVYKDTVDQLLFQLETQPSLPAPLLRVPDQQNGDWDWTAEEAMLQDASVEPFEQLSKAAHHYCDLVRAEDYQQSSKALEVRLRRRIFAVLLSHIEHFRVAAAGFIAELEARPEFHHAQHILLGTLAKLLKKAAEAGNDVFGAETSHPERLRVGAQVFGLLEELESVVHESSKHVPLHMRALLHQALGSWYHNRAVQELQSSKPNALPVREMAPLNLQQAVKHLRASLDAFSQRRESLRISQQQEMLLEDSSTLLEVSLSMQLLAGVVCTQGNYEEGLYLWDEAIAQARSSLMGIEFGIRYDNLAVTLYNAALCHSAVGRVAVAEDFATEAATIAKLSSRTSGEVAALVQAAEDLQSAARAQAFRSERSEDRKDGLGLFGTQPTITFHTSEGKEEWVECALDEDCELLSEGVPEREASYRQQQQDHYSTPQTSEGEDHLLKGLDLSDMTAEEVDELRDTRARHSRITRQGVGSFTAGPFSSRSYSTEAQPKADAGFSSFGSQGSLNSCSGDAVELVTLRDRVRQLEADRTQIEVQVQRLSSAVLHLERRLLVCSKTLE